MSSQEFDVPVFHDTLDDVLSPSCNTVLHGHDEPMSHIARSANLGTLHHGLVFEGNLGIGKATAAFHLANWLLNGSPPTLDNTIPPVDPQSATFRQIAQDAHPNLLHLRRQKSEDGKRFKQDISVDDIRRLHRFLNMSAGNSGYRVIIIDAANDMNRNSSNALLKMLEEPPAKTLFILIAHGAGGLLPTIRSRTQTIRFKPLRPDDLTRALAHADTSQDMSAEQLNQLAILSGGSVRQGLLMSKYGGVELDSALGSLLDAQRFDTKAAHELANVAGARGADIHDRLLSDLLLERVRSEAQLRAGAGDIGRANRLAEFEASLLERKRIADAYNLNRKQEFLVTIAETHELFRTLAA